MIPATITIQISEEMKENFNKNFQTISFNYLSFSSENRKIVFSCWKTFSDHYGFGNVFWKKDISKKMEKILNSHFLSRTFYFSSMEFHTSCFKKMFEQNFFRKSTDERWIMLKQEYSKVFKYSIQKFSSISFVKELKVKIKFPIENYRKITQFSSNRFG